MKARTRGRRHVSLFYQRTMDRIWQATLPFGGLLIGLWYFHNLLLPELSDLTDMTIFIGGIIVLAIGAWALISRSMSYYQVFSDHLRLVTPYMRLKFSFRRVVNIRPNKFSAIFSIQEASWADRAYLEPFAGRTVVVVSLSDYPMREGTMRLFLPKMLFPTKGKGLVLLVQDWMVLSSELDSYLNSWRQSQLHKQNRPSSGLGLLDNLPR